MVVLQGMLMGPLTAWLGEWRFLRLGIGGLCLGLLLAVFAQGMIPMVASMFVAMTGATLCMPLLNTLVSRRTPLELRGRMIGTTGSAGSWGRVLGPLVAGLVLASAGYPYAWALLLVVSLFYFSWAVLAHD